jgi:anti-sigma regulatory factor (Ser/Thr protein kinase)
MTTMDVPETPPTEPEVRYRLGDLARLRQHVARAGGTAGLTPERIAPLTVAVNEVVTNAIQHATGSALVAISRARDRLTVQVTDDGPGLPDSVTEERSQPSVDSLGGRGLWFVRQFCDQVHIQTGDTGTRVRLVMLLAAPTNRDR